MNPFKEVAESLVLITLLLVAVVCGMLLERRWSAIETRQDAQEARQLAQERITKKIDAVMFGEIH